MNLGSCLIQWIKPLVHSGQFHLHRLTGPLLGLGIWSFTSSCIWDTFRGTCWELNLGSSKWQACAVPTLNCEYRNSFINKTIIWVHRLSQYRLLRLVAALNTVRVLAHEGIISIFQGKLWVSQASSILTTGPGIPRSPSGPGFPGGPWGPMGPVFPGGPSKPDSPWRRWEACKYIATIQGNQERWMMSYPIPTLGESPIFPQTQ